MIIVLLAVAGFLISLYGFFIEQKLKTDPDYKPLCEISDRASCIKPLTSPLGKLFGIHNTIIGMFFYAVIALLALFGFYQLIFIGAVAASIISLYLAYILYSQIKTVCVLCTMIYVINGALLVVSAWYYS